MAQNHFQEPFDHAGKAEYAFGDFLLDSDGTLHRGPQLVHLPPKELAALRYLIENAGRIVTPNELRTALWGDVHVTADSVPKCISALRTLLEPADCIQTVYKRGYRFVADPVPADHASTSPLPRLVILPFASEFGVPEHLGGHAAEEAMMQLNRIQPALVAVMARDSVFTLSRRGMTAVEVGRTMKADLALAGTIRALPAHFRFRAELIRVSDGAQLWAEDMLVERGRPEELETALSRQLIFRLTGSSHVLSGASITASSTLESRKVEPRNEANPQQREAYEIYQRAHFEWQTLQRHRMQDSLQHLLRATELDPGLIDAWEDLVNLCIAQELFGFMSPAVAAEIARRAFVQIPNIETRAEKLLPALGWLEFHFNGDLESALRMMSLSAHLPHDPWVTRCRVMFSLSRHRFDEAIETLQAALAIDPFSPWLQARLAWSLHLKGEAAASVRQAMRALELFPDLEAPALYGSHILAHNGETKRAVELAKNLAKRLPYFDLATAAHAYTLAAAGEQEEARATLERLQWLGRERFVISSCTPPAWVALGDHESALNALRIAETARCPWFFQMLADPRLKPLDHHGDFQRMKRVRAQMESSTSYN